MTAPAATPEAPASGPLPPPARCRRRGIRRTLSSAMIVAGALLLTDGAATLLWQEPLSSVYAHVQQGRLGDRLARIERAPVTPAEARVLKRLPDPARRLAFSARALARRTRAGDPLGRLRIRRLGLSKVIVEGTDAGDLREGPGHYPATPLPGRPGTVAIAGHRTTYGAPFRHVDRLRPGDGIELAMPYGTFEYLVERTRIVPPTALWVTQRVSYDRLILSACHPLYSAAKRIVVFARLTSAWVRT